MSQPLRQIKNRIRTVENVKKVMNAIEMVSVAKLNSINRLLAPILPYTSRLESMLHDLISSEGEFRSPFFEKRNDARVSALCVITSDNGLCGMYNYNVARAAEEFIEKKGRDNVKLIVLGKKGLAHFRNRGYKIPHIFIDLHGRYNKPVFDEINSLLTDLFLKNEAGEVYVAYTRIKKGMGQKVSVEKFLNIEAPGAGHEQYIVEPEFNAVLSDMVPRYIAAKWKLIVLEALAAEHTARSISMKAATDNAKELLESLVLARNKIRQAGITTDIMEIVSAAEALKG
ncbi:MAG: ATP synthase F1 subunit gamma [Candidatus Omnitrophota bacterium]|nr:ATP synthase F1 subunit gamma [Candidatus Omnitrophota bacterium]